MGTQVSKKETECALGLYERAEELRRDFPDMDLGPLMVEKVPDGKPRQPFYRWIITRSDFLAWRGFFSTTRLICPVCRHCHRVAGTWDDWCDKFDCKVTDEMKRRDDCPEWQYDFDDGWDDIPY